MSFIAIFVVVIIMNVFIIIILFNNSTKKEIENYKYYNYSILSQPFMKEIHKYSLN